MYKYHMYIQIKKVYFSNKNYNIENCTIKVLKNAMIFENLNF